MRKVVTSLLVILLASLTSFVSVAICGQRAPERHPTTSSEVQQWVGKLKDPTSSVRRKAADKLGDIGVEAIEAVPALVEALEDPFASVRKEVADALGDIARKAGGRMTLQVTPALGKALKSDPDAAVRKEIIEALERVGRKADPEGAARVLRALIPSVNDLDPSVRREGIEALEDVICARVPKLRSRLVSTPSGLVDGRSKPICDEESGRKLEGAVAEVLEALARAYRAGDVPFRREIVEVLEGIASRTPGAISVLTDALRDRDRRVREDAAEALGDVGHSAGLIVAVEAIEALEKVTKSDPDSSVRKESLRALEDIGRKAGPRATARALGALARMLEDRECPFRKEVVEASGGVLGKAADHIRSLNRPVETPAGANGGRPEERAAVVRELEAGAIEAVRAARGVIHEGNKDLRKRFVEVLGDIGAGAGADLTSQTLSALLEALKDPSDDVREAAAASLGDMGQRARDAVPALITCLRDPDWATREEAARALGRIGGALEDIDPKLIAALTDALLDPKNDVRRRAAGALGGLGPRARDAAPSLRKALDDDDERVRREAASALRRIEPPSVNPR